MSLIKLASNPLSRKLEKYKEAIIFMTGSQDFVPGGKARKGFNKIVRPVLNDINNDTLKSK